MNTKGRKLKEKIFELLISHSHFLHSLFPALFPALPDEEGWSSIYRRGFKRELFFILENL